MSIELDELYPGRRSVDTDTVYDELKLGDAAPGDRPYVVLNMVSTADGKATIEGRSGKIGDEADKALFHELRTQVDAVMVGAGTLRAERYGRLVRDPDLRAKRERQGLAADPLAVVVTRSLRLPTDAPLMQDASGRVVVFTSSDAQLETVPAVVTVQRIDEATDLLSAALRSLRSEHGVRSLLVEGGPTVNHDLFAAGLVDELFLSLAPLVAGGREALTIVAGEPLEQLVEMELLAVHRHASNLFLRYRLRR